MRRSMQLAAAFGVGSVAVATFIVLVQFVYVPYVKPKIDEWREGSSHKSRRRLETPHSNNENQHRRRSASSSPSGDESSQDAFRNSRRADNDIQLSSMSLNSNMRRRAGHAPGDESNVPVNSRDENPVTTTEMLQTTPSDMPTASPHPEVEPEAPVHYPEAQPSTPLPSGSPHLHALTLSDSHVQSLSSMLTPEQLPTPLPERTLPSPESLSYDTPLSRPISPETFSTEALLSSQTISSPLNPRSSTPQPTFVTASSPNAVEAQSFHSLASDELSISASGTEDMHPSYSSSPEHVNVPLNSECEDEGTDENSDGSNESWEDVRSGAISPMSF